MKAVNIFTVGVVGLHLLPGVLLLSVCTFVSPSIPSLGGDPNMGEGERAGRSPILRVLFREKRTQFRGGVQH